MSGPRVHGTAGRLYDRYIRMARAQLNHRAELAKPRGRVRDDKGRYVSDSVAWTRYESLGGDGKTRPLPWFLGAEAKHEPEWLIEHAESVRVWAFAFVASAVWLMLGWGLTGAVVVLLSVFVVRRMFAKPS